MPATIESLGIDKLSRPERINLARMILDTVSPDEAIREFFRADNVMDRSKSSPSGPILSEVIAVLTPADVGGTLSSPTALVFLARAYLRAMFDVAKSAFGSPFTDTVIDVGPSLIEWDCTAV